MSIVTIMDLYTLQCVICGGVQPKATVVSPDPSLLLCCTALDTAIVSQLKRVDRVLTPVGACFFCKCNVHDNSVYCGRQSCAVLHASRAAITLFHMRPCAWPPTHESVLCPDTEWTPSQLREQEGCQPISSKLRSTLESLVYEDPLEAFLAPLGA